MYIEASYPRVKGDKARIISPLFTQFTSTGGGSECITFYYHMYGQDAGTLRLYALTSTSDLLWTRSKDQGNGWRIAQVKVN